MATNIPIAGVGGQCGVCRFGADPSITVLAPAVTAMANARGVGEHFPGRLG
jgi:hypothetical protein